MKVVEASYESVAVNLLTDEIEYYTDLTPLQAVKSSYARENGLSTQLAVKGIDDLDLEIHEGEFTVGCGDWVSLKQ